VLLVNPAARGGRAMRLLEPVARHLRAGGAELSVISGRDAAEALDRARAAVAERPDALVAFGGDGLVHLAVQAVAGTGVPLGVIPAGTGNDIADALGVPCGDPAAAVRTVLRMRPRPIDAAAVRTGAAGEPRAGQPGTQEPGVEEPGAEELFAGVLCCGFDSRVNERANRLTWPPGRARYLAALAGELRAFRPIPMRITLDGRSSERRVMLVAVANTRSYGAGMRVCPGARPDDGLLDVVVLGELGKPEFLRAFPRVYRGTHVTHPAVTITRARSVRLEALDPEGAGVVAYADGERVGPVPVSCEIRPGVLSVLL
jgi:diacylglycerol kinase (ATP)